ncbi:hypothetical protein DSO57_1004606 [Entomophthora muscae]|uniref:Uncharacterized protein n=1 Tax=Entomophthora muscae TaxID=34485 RepID=A0ACC2TVJ5_9FUNG|nr:hypothetical protein DSO57_1004606 [Entomophthora muscae]
MVGFIHWLGHTLVQTPNASTYAWLPEIEGLAEGMEDDSEGLAEEVEDDIEGLAE